MGGVGYTTETATITCFAITVSKSKHVGFVRHNSAAETELSWYFFFRVHEIFNHRWCHRLCSWWANGEKKIGNVFKNKLKECSPVLPSSPDEQKAVTIRPLVLDIGANAGIYGLYAGKMGCQTYFFEIQPVCIRNIYSSILINSMDGHASIIPFPVGNETNKVIELDESSHCFAIYRVSTGNQHEEYEKHQKVHSTFKTKIVRIEDVFHHAMQTSKLDTWCWYIKSNRYYIH